jgi:hypothetical protein
MNISQALRRIAVIKGQLAMVTMRFASAVTWIDDAVPTYALDECDMSWGRLVSEQTALEAAVAIANANTKITFRDKQYTLAFTVKQLAVFKSKIALLRTLNCQPARERVDIVRDNEYLNGNYVTVTHEKKIHCAFTERERDLSVEKAQADFDELNALVEAANHTVQVDPQVV